jgi:hypothetical protein
MVPLMAGGILAGFVTSFHHRRGGVVGHHSAGTSSEAQAPMSYGIYLYMQSIAGRGPGAALGVIASWWWWRWARMCRTVSSKTRANRCDALPATGIKEAPDMHLNKVPQRARPPHQPEPTAPTEVLKDVTLRIEPGEFFLRCSGRRARANPPCCG